MNRSPSEKLLAKLETRKLSTLPQILLKLMQACNDPEVNFDRLADLIKRDAALSAKVLNVANSPFYMQWGKTSDINRLLVVLGLSTIKTIAITSSVMQFFSQFAPRRESYLKRFWYSSLHCAYTAKALAELTSYEFPEEAYLAGLLHKLGQLVLLDSFSEKYIEVHRGAKDTAALADREEREYGLTHAELGAWLIEQWEADDFVSDAVRFQDESLDSIQDAHQLVKLINLASKFDNLLPQEPQHQFEAADELFGLAEPVVSELLQRVREDVDNAAKALKISIDPSLPVDQEPPSAAGDMVDEDRLELARLVRDMALMDGSAQTLRLARGTDETLVAIRHNAGILFGLGNAMFFLLDDAGHLRGYPLGNQKPQVSRLVVPLEAGRSLLSDAVLGKASVDSFSTENVINVFDRQLIRLSGKEGMVAVPLQIGSKTLGVLAAGISRAEAQMLASQQELLQVFSQEAAGYLDNCLREDAQAAETRAEEQAMVRLRARKIVHEANNPLGIINNYLHILGQKLGQDHAAAGDLDIIREEIERVGRILLRLPDEMQQQPAKPGVTAAVDLSELLRGLNGVFESSLFSTHDIRSELQLDRNIPAIETNRDKLKQVVINLMKNAAEALPKGGRITVTSQDNINLDGRNYVEITISDNGPGMPAEVMKNIFNPVKTTKEGTHSGLGLTIARNLVNELGGTISCRSSSRGTRFEILIPRKAAATYPPKHKRTALGRRAKISL